MKTIKQPKTNTQEVLFTLIQQGHVSIFDYPYMSGFRTRVSDLRNKHGLKIKTIMDSRHNKFGNRYAYAVHFIEDLEQAKSVYNELTK